MRAWQLCGIGAMLVLGGCGSERDDAGPSETGLPTGLGGGSTGGVGDDDAEGGETMKLDVAVGESSGAGDDGGSADSCMGVDILFIVDDSQSMEDDQMALAAAFPSFAEEIFAALPEGISVHVGVTTTSGFWRGVNEENTNNCISDYSVAELSENYWPPVAGDTPINGQRGALYEHEGMPYFATNTDDDPALLSAWFSGAALRGETGTNVEFMSAAAAWALDPIHAGSNGGFLRDDNAVLVLFFITDEPDKSPEPVQQFVDMVLDAKAECGGADCIVTAGAVPMHCYADPGDTTLATFMSGFGKPPAALGHIPESFIDPPPPQPDYTGILGSALAGVIAQTCDAIAPQG